MHVLVFAGMPSAGLAEKQGFSMDPQDSSPFFFRCRIRTPRQRSEADGHDGKTGSQAGRDDDARKEIHEESSVPPPEASDGQEGREEEFKSGER
jgi:hypothetical protein